MKFILGIGNDDKKYRGTRHNVGFQVVDGMAQGTSWRDRSSWKASVARRPKELSLVKSKLFVNNTGQTVWAIVKKSRAVVGNILVVCDDVNLEFGKLRLRESGKSGGHHGLESIIEKLGSEDFPRLRIGIRNSETPKEVTNFVLEPFTVKEREMIGQVVDNAAVVCQTWADQGFNPALNQLSRLQG